MFPEISNQIPRYKNSSLCVDRPEILRIDTSVATTPISAVDKIRVSDVKRTVAHTQILAENTS